MAIIHRVEKKVRMNQWDIVRFQLIVHCYLSDIHLSQHDLECLTMLGITGEKTLEEFCSITREKKIFMSNQSARNALAKAEKKNLIIKDGRNKKKIYLNPALKIQAYGNILLDVRIFRPEPVTELEPV